MRSAQEVIQNFLNQETYKITEEDIEIVKKTNPINIFPQSSEVAIKVHQQLLLKTHPDKNIDQTPEYQQVLARFFGVIREKYAEFVKTNWFNPKQSSTSAEEESRQADSLPAIEQKLFFDESICDMQTLQRVYRPLSPERIYQKLMKDGCPKVLSPESRKEREKTRDQISFTIDFIGFLAFDYILSDEQAAAFMYGVAPYEGVLPPHPYEMSLFNRSINRAALYLKVTKHHWDPEFLVFGFGANHYFPGRYAFALICLDETKKVLKNAAQKMDEDKISSILTKLVHYLTPLFFEQYFPFIKSLFVNIFPISYMPNFLQILDASTEQYKEMECDQQVQLWDIPKNFTIPKEKNILSADRTRSKVIELFKDQFRDLFSEGVAQFPVVSELSTAMVVTQAQAKPSESPLLNFLRAIHPKHFMEIINCIPTVFSMLYRSSLPLKTYLPKVDLKRIDPNEIASMYCCFAQRTLFYSQSLAHSSFTAKMWATCTSRDTQFIAELKKLLGSPESDGDRAIQIHQLCSRFKPKLSAAMQENIANYHLLDTAIPLSPTNALKGRMMVPC